MTEMLWEDAPPTPLEEFNERIMLNRLAERYSANPGNGPRYVYEPTVEREAASRSAVRHLLSTFFDGSVEQAMTALLDATDRKLSREEVDRLGRLIEQRKREGR